MGTELTQKKVPALRRLLRRNTMAFPRELRDAIPDLYTGRVLELDSVNGQVLNTVLFGSLVSLKMIVQETGKLEGQFVVRMDLQPDAARQLAATLSQLADEAERSEPSELPRVVRLFSKPEDE